MGGWGSGQRSGRACTEDCRQIDVRRLQRDGLLKRGAAFRWQWSEEGRCTASVNMSVSDVLHLSYRHRYNGGDWQDASYSVSLAWTSCTYGGERAWFRCPAAQCGRRVAILHMGNGGIFACRHCYRLAYRSQRETADDRASRRADKLRARLGWESGILNGEGGKPKGMRWRTFNRLAAEHNYLVARALADIMRHMGR